MMKYEGYIGYVEFDVDAEIFHSEVIFKTNLFYPMAKL